MTLKEITQRIQDSQQIAGSDPATALKLNRNLFVDIARQDEIYLVPEAEVSLDALEQKLFRPYIAPAQENDPRLFLRIFSHKDAAESFAERLGRSQTCMIDGVELIQLAKTYFLRGVYGFLLNDGMAWTALSFPDFLVDCFRDILGDDSLARSEYISLIQFINMVRQNKYYHIQAGHQEVLDATKPIQARFMDQPQSVWTSDVGEWIYEDCAINHLMQASGLNQDAIVYIKTAKCELQISPAQLRAALCATGLAEPGTQFDLDFHTDAIALDYRLEDFDLERLPLQVQITELPRAGFDEEDEPQEKHGEKERTPRKVPFAGIFAKFKRKKSRSMVEDPGTADEDEEVLDVPVATAEDIGEESVEEKPEKARKFKAFGIMAPSPKLMVRLFFVAAFLIIVAAILVQVFKPVPKEELVKAMEAGNHTEVVALYNKCVTANPDNKEELLQLLAGNLDNKLEAYAADEITANQLAETITTYEKIPAMASKCDAVYVQASALEQSKIVYQQGLLETSMSKRLAIWRDVIQADTGSQKAMRSSLDENADMYKSFVFAEADRMEVGEALKSLNILQSYYPNDNEVSKHIKEWLDTVSKPTQPPQQGNSTGSLTGDEERDWPVIVQDIFVTKEEGPYDLHIQWGNVAGRTIEKVVFNVTPLNAAGEPVYTEDVGNGIYSDYMAISQGPYEDGYEMPKSYMWPSAWVNSEQMVVAIRLNSIQVFYTDGNGSDGTEAESWSSHEVVQFGELPELSDTGTEDGKKSDLFLGPLGGLL